MIENSADKNILNFKALIAVSPTEGCMTLILIKALSYT